MKIAFLTSGGNAPCLNSSIGRIIYNFINSNIVPEFMGYKNGFSGLLRGDSISIPANHSDNELEFYNSLGGSVIGNSRTKLTNIDDCRKKGLIKNNQIPLEVAAEQLIKDKIDILFAIGGDDTNCTAKDLYNYISSKNTSITVIGIPKTVDNDIYPVKRSLGAFTAAEMSSLFFSNIVNENFMGTKHLIIHEVMGRNCGWLTANTAKFYYNMLDEMSTDFIHPFNIGRYGIHGLYIPEIEVDFVKEISRLNHLMENIGCLNIFVCEGSFSDKIAEQLENNGENVEKDAFGHIRLDSIDTGKWLSEILKKEIEIDRVLIQKSGYFARSSKPAEEEVSYISKICDFAFIMSQKNTSGVAGEDERTGKLQVIDFNDIKGDKPFDIGQDWFKELMSKIECS